MKDKAVSPPSTASAETGLSPAEPISGAPPKGGCKHSGKRKRGGQPGNQNARGHGAPRANTNALKHGLYAKYYRPAEIAELAEHTSTDLTAEMSLLRVIISRLVARAADPQDPDLAKNVLTISAATARLASLARKQWLIKSPANEIDRAVQEAIQDLVKEMHK